jgi:hypothetical protein
VKRLSERLLGFALLLGLFAFGQQEVFAQAGSTGGSIGKQDKSISGGEEPAHLDRRTNATPPHLRSSAPKRLTAASIEGSWDWEASCKGEQWQGGMTLHAVSVTGFTGEFSKGHEGPGTGEALLFFDDRRGPCIVSFYVFRSSGYSRHPLSRRCNREAPAEASARLKNRYREAKAQSRPHRRNLARRANRKSIETPLINRPKLPSPVDGAGSQIVTVVGVGRGSLI